jgi:hypothetical protein
MRRWRVWIVCFLIIFLLVGHAIDIASLREHWPFSYYPMYARVEKKRRVTLLSAYALMRAPGYRALVRLTDAKYVPPLNEGRLRVILMAAYRRGERPEDIAAARQVLADYMRTYESRRIAGLHDGPPMREIWLYRLTWRLRPDGTARTKPSIEEPLLVVKLDELSAPIRPPTETPPPPTADPLTDP